jgi:hypothetical protein
VVPDPSDYGLRASRKPTIMPITIVTDSATHNGV